MKNKLTGALFISLIFGCADEIGAPAEDGGADATSPFNDEPNLPVACPSYVPNRCEDECVSFDLDPLNCGECGHACESVYSDGSCIDGICHCGPDSVECTPPHVCYKGLCVAPDRKGEPCDEIEGMSCGDDLECVSGPEGGFCTRVDPEGEICNGRDDDKDGLTDEVEETIRSCYDGPPETQSVGPCRQGYQICIWDEFEQGYSECREQVLPVPETGLLACDGVDNNCDGCVDGIAGKDKCLPGNPLVVDVCFAIDISGSMADNIVAVRDVMAGFASLYSTTSEIEWCIVAYADPSSGDVFLIQDLTDYTTFLAALGMISASGGAEEGNWDSIYQMATDDPALAVSFRDGSQRLYILITDEHGQSYLAPEITEAGMCASLTDEIFAAIVDPGYFSDFDDCGAAGSPFILSDDVDEMVSNLEMIFTTPCK